LFHTIATEKITSSNIHYIHHNIARFLNTPTVLEFGTAWCGYCQAAQPHIAAAFADYPQISHIKVEDGRGRPLGRSFDVKLWPKLVSLKDGKEVTRLVRPQSAAKIGEAMRKISDHGKREGKGDTEQEGSGGNSHP
jgi:thioredoxin 1